MSLCLNMIVRNEAGCIEETLRNVSAHLPVTCWAIHDTGSTDGTPELIEKTMADLGLPGKLSHRSWKSFGDNRQYALEEATGLTEYVLFFDADNRIEGDVPALPWGPDGLTLNMRRNTTVYPAKLIVRNDGRFRWRGVVHEGLYFKGTGRETTQHLTGNYTVVSESSGARSRDPATYYRDARLLADAIKDLAAEDRDLLPRYAFYCANSWRDAQAPNEAAAWYRKRLALGGWKDELYLSWLGLGIELIKVDSRAAAIQAFLSGTELCPERAECFYQLARYLRLWGKPGDALRYAKQGLQCPTPEAERLFVWRDVYRFWMDFEFLCCLRDLGQSGRKAARSLARMKANGAPEHLFQMLGPDILREGRPVPMTTVSSRG